MSQSDILSLLQEAYKEDPNKWLTSKEIKQIMLNKGLTNGVLHNATNDILKLTCFHCIKFKENGIIRTVRSYKFR